MSAGLVTYDEAAALVGVKPATVRSWKRRGWLVEFSPGLFHTDAVYRCERDRRRSSTRPVNRFGKVFPSDS